MHGEFRAAITLGSISRFKSITFVTCNSWPMSIKHLPCSFPDVPAAASSVPELQQYSAVRVTAAAAEAGGHFSAAACPQSSAPRANRISTNTEPASTEGSKCDIEPGNHLFVYRNIYMERRHWAVTRQASKVASILKLRLSFSILLPKCRLYKVCLYSIYFTLNSFLRSQSGELPTACHAGMLLECLNVDVRCMGWAWGNGSAASSICNQDLWEWAGLAQQFCLTADFWAFPSLLFHPPDVPPFKGATASIAVLRVHSECGCTMMRWWLRALSLSI